MGLVTDPATEGGNGTLAAVVPRELVDRGVGGTGYTTFAGTGASWYKGPVGFDRRLWRFGGVVSESAEPMAEETASSESEDESRSAVRLYRTADCPPADGFR